MDRWDGLQFSVKLFFRSVPSTWTSIPRYIVPRVDNRPGTDRVLTSANMSHYCCGQASAAYTNPFALCFIGYLPSLSNLNYQSKLIHSTYRWLRQNKNIGLLLVSTRDSLYKTGCLSRHFSESCPGFLINPTVKNFGDYSCHVCMPAKADGCTSSALKSAPLTDTERNLYWSTPIIVLTRHIWVAPIYCFL